MRNLLFLTIITIWSCTTQSQQLNNEINKIGKKPYLLGKIDKQGLTAKNYKNWFLSGFNEYQPKQEIIDKIANKLKRYDITVFMGTWCGDSRREVPRFYKVLEAVNYPLEQLTMVAVGREAGMYKRSPNHEEKGLNIHRVPTFIFYKKGKEVNRIVEHPVKTLEEDILDLIKGDYRSNYYVVTMVNELIENDNFYEAAHQNLNAYKELVSNMYELNTYARILRNTNREDKANEVLKINVHLFPDQPNVYKNLADSYLKLDEKHAALDNYEKAYELNPKNEKFKNKIAQLKSELASVNN